MNEVKIKESTRFVEGSLAKEMLRFAAPLLATSILLQLFNTFDSSIAGLFISERALAAVGSTTMISTFFIEFFMGFSNAAGVVISRFMGKGAADRANKAVSTSVIVAFLCGLLIAVTGVLYSRPLLILMKVPDNILDPATVYLKLYLASMPFFMLYQFCATIFRSGGDTKTPMFCLVASGALKVGLDFILVLALDMEILGMALATVLANVFGAVILLFFLARRNDFLRLRLKNLSVDFETVRSLLAIGLPSAFLGSVFSVSNLMVQSAINSLGTDAIAATTAAGNIEIYIQFIGNAFASAAITFTAQNHGAKRVDRLKLIPVIAILLCDAVSLPLSLLSYAFAPTLLRMFVTEGSVITLAILRMRYTLLFKPIQAIMDIMSGTLQGYGYTLVPAVTSIFFVCGVRILWLNTYFAAHPSLGVLMFIYPITQTLASISHMLCYLRVKRRISKKYAV